ncbi:DUF2330 domain-containing protein [Chamaesiphon minutus]|uniref:DUF2330 domain-containing protein n=1 Tax=Chamaesiphon minutus (strain ATCC 27169 / PCC 6605) TaxID=1173020 RepID=K9UPE6_CHAP6|nr:DUF2330 domain-containing protein [Chamaesiphon minutus]AFY96079.1 hypothetical protein Cha6605_5185 [Chamaesiphon minutus PCC 6605]
MKISQIIISLCLACILVLACATQALAFCGFYVGGADAKLFNKASQVIIARNGDRTILTMANDFQGAIKDFAMVVPVPVAIKKEQVHVGKRTTIEKLDAFSQPRLVEYFDPDPCADTRLNESATDTRAVPSAAAPIQRARKAQGNLGVTVEDTFKVNEYDIVILSAKQSDGLETWLRQNGYNIPKGASELLSPYIKQKLKFFVAKIDLQEFDKSGYQLLRPLQIAYESPKFMLPIRLGMINSRGEQDLVVYVLSPKGRVELTNYRTVKIPTDKSVPEFVKSEFGDFYKATFQRIYEREQKKVAFLEYAWNVSNCDPCSSDPPNQTELREAGVFWEGNSDPSSQPSIRSRRPIAFGNTFITRVHVRYTRNKFPEDLMFQETGNQENFQGRYVMRHPFKGNLSCDAGKRYKQSLQARLEQEAGTLANLTGWSIRDIYTKMDFSITQPKKAEGTTPFWRNVWNDK